MRDCLVKMKTNQWLSLMKKMKPMKKQHLLLILNKKKKKKMFNLLSLYLSQFSFLELIEIRWQHRHR